MISSINLPSVLPIWQKKAKVLYKIKYILQQKTRVFPVSKYQIRIKHFVWASWACALKKTSMFCSLYLSSRFFVMSPGKPKRSYFREILVDEDLLLLTGLFYPNFPAHPFVKMHLIILENVFQFFLAFFLAMYVEVKARHTVYQLICKFFYLNHEW